MSVSFKELTKLSISIASNYGNLKNFEVPMSSPEADVLHEDKNISFQPSLRGDALDIDAIQDNVLIIVVIILCTE